MADYHDKLSTFYEDVTMPGGYPWSHTDTLRTIENYYNSHFTDGQNDSRGFRKYFYNINKPACDIATKFIDLDTKDILLRHELADQEWKVWIMMHDLRGWLKKEEFGKLLNKLAVDLPKFGHIFVKKVKGRWEKVNIQNVRFDPASPHWFF